MSELTVVQFESQTFGNSYVSELSDGPPYTVHGVALGADDVTVGQSGIKKLWPAEELKQAAETLKGTNLVVDHENNATGVVGRVTKAGYKDGTGVVYQAELYEDELAEKIENGLLEVSIRGYHADVDSLEEDDENGAKVVEDIQFDNLSIVPTGAAPSNTLQMGEHAELSAAELSAFTDSLDAAELEEEIEPGMWVTDGDIHGITISQVQDGEIEVDLYEEQDDQWRSIEKTEMMSTDALEEWDIDEDDISAVEKEDNSDDSEDDSDADEEEAAQLLRAGMTFYDRVNESKHMISSIDGNMVEIEGEDGDNWDETKEDVFEKIAQEEWILEDNERSSEEMASTGDKVSWSSSGGQAQGVVRERKTEGCFNEEIDGDFEVCADEDEAIVLIEIVKDGEATGTMVAHKENTVNSADFEMSPMDADESPDSPDDMRDDSKSVQPPSWEDGQMVKWQVNPQMKGKIVHVDQAKKVLMVEVMEDTEQGLQPTGYTLTTGYQDVVPMDKEMAASTTRDVPTQDAEPSHDSESVKSLLKQFIEQNTDADPTIDDFMDWMNEENLSMNSRNEGEEEVLDSRKKLKDSHHGEPHRYTDAEDESTELAESYDDYPEAASKNAQMALDAREETDNPNDCGTDVGWKRANQLANGEGLTREQVGKMSAFARHEQNSEMDDEDDKADCGWMMWKAWGGDEGVEWAKQKLEKIEEEAAMDDIDPEHVFASKDAAMEKAKELDLEGVHEMDGRWVPGESHKEYMDNVASSSKHGDEMDEDEDEDEDEMATATDEGDESSDVAELEDYEMSTPDWSGTTTQDWSSPDMEDFDTDDLGEVADHFLISSSGFPPESFSDLKLPVVEPNGDLNVNALAAVKGGRGVSAVDGLSSDMEDEIVQWVNKTAADEFDKDWGMDEEENAEVHKHQIDGTGGRPTPGENTVGGVRVLSGDDLQDDGKSEESDADSLETYNITTMNEEIEEKLSELDEPVAVEASEVEELRNKADRFEEMSESLEALRERTDILDEVDRSQVEALAEAEDPVVEESARFEELQSEAEQVSGVYAAQLAEQYPAFSADELTDKFSIEELREKFEEQIGDVEEELASSEDAEPRSQDADEESLEEAAESDESDADEAELSDEVAAKQEEIRNKILR